MTHIISQRLDSCGRSDLLGRWGLRLQGLLDLLRGRHDLSGGCFGSDGDLLGDEVVRECRCRFGCRSGRDVDNQRSGFELRFGRRWRSHDRFRFQFRFRFDKRFRYGFERGRRGRGGRRSVV